MARSQKKAVASASEAYRQTAIPGSWTMMINKPSGTTLGVAALIVAAILAVVAIAIRL